MQEDIVVLYPIYYMDCITFYPYFYFVFHPESGPFLKNPKKYPEKFQKIPGKFTFVDYPTLSPQGIKEVVSSQSPGIEDNK